MNGLLQEVAAEATADGGPDTRSYISRSDRGSRSRSGEGNGSVRIRGSSCSAVDGRPSARLLAARRVGGSGGDRQGKPLNSARHGSAWSGVGATGSPFSWAAGSVAGTTSQGDCRPARAPVKEKNEKNGPGQRKGNRDSVGVPRSADLECRRTEARTRFRDEAPVAGTALLEEAGLAPSWTARGCPAGGGCRSRSACGPSGRAGCCGSPPSAIDRHRRMFHVEHSSRNFFHCPCARHPRIGCIAPRHTQNGGQP
jgi:hypothetical protein